MRTLVAALLFCLIGRHAQAQQQAPTGNLTVVFLQNELVENIRLSKVCITINQHDSVIRKSCLGQKYRVFFGKLNVGKYDVVVFIDDVKRATIHDVDVDTLYASSLTIHPVEFSYVNKYQSQNDSLAHYSDPHHKSKVQGNYFTWNVLKGVPLNNQSIYLGNEFQFSLVWGFPLVRKKHFNLPFEFGFNTGYCKINSDTTLFTVKPTTAERYGFLNCTFGLMNTWRFAVDSATNTSKAMLQYGVAYNFPFIYNHTGTSGNKRTQSKAISTYENIYLVGRLGFGGFVKIGIQAEYNLGPHLKRQYPQPADFRFGLFYFQKI